VEPCRRESGLLRHGESFATGWPKIDKGKLISFPNLSKKEKGSLEAISKPLQMNQIGCGGLECTEDAFVLPFRYELTSQVAA
jgi:hypothetical protein